MEDIKFERNGAEEFMHNFSKRLIQKGYDIISGFGLGGGSFIINGVFDEVYYKVNYIDNRIIMSPFPQKSSGRKILKEIWTDYRKEMISLAGISIFIFGNNKDSNGNTIEANEMIDEFNIAKEENTFIIHIILRDMLVKQSCMKSKMTWINIGA